MRYLTVRGRYGDVFGRLADVWCALLKREALISSVVEDVDRAEGDRLVALVVSVFLRDEFVRQAKTPPLFWVGPELIRRIMQNDSPVLERAGIRRANSQDGLNLFVWETDIRLTGTAEFFPAAAELGQAAIGDHIGFKIKEVMGQPPPGPVLKMAIEFGDCFLHQPAGQYVPVADAEGKELGGGPYILGLTRELACDHPGVALGFIFNYQHPRLFLTLAEQRLVKAALNGYNNEQIACALAVSLSTVKKGWQSIYTKASLRAPGLMLDGSFDPLHGNGRGAEKKRRLLVYVRTYPEELRPVLSPPAAKEERERTARPKENRAPTPHGTST